MNSSRLTHRQKVEIVENGFTQIPGVVPSLMVDAARRAINHSLGEGIPKENIARYRAQSYCEEINRAPVITDLLNCTPAFSLAESAIGEGKIRPATNGQIALRFPSLQDSPAAPKPHIDGFYTPDNGVPEGTVQNFTMLVGVLLSDLPQPDAGNFTVWPGSHRKYEKYFRENGAQVLAKGTPKIDLGAPLQITGRAGDVVLVHYELGHGITPNISPHIRYAIFFRISHLELDSHRWESLTDIWLDWEGLRDLAPKT